MDAQYILALDVGERRIGVALASSIARLPAVVTTIDRNELDAFTVIGKLVTEHGVGTVVVGLPRNMQGEDTAQTTYCREFAAELEEKLGIPVLMQDEAATSIEAEEYLKRSGKPYAKGDIDAHAAVIILRDWLAGQVGRTA
jgi:putative Holliday junction resolvase